MWGGVSKSYRGSRTARYSENAVVIEVSEGIGAHFDICMGYKSDSIITGIGGLTLIFEVQSLALMLLVYGATRFQQAIL
jgi:hypothetical protein